MADPVRIGKLQPTQNQWLDPAPMAKLSALRQIAAPRSSWRGLTRWGQGNLSVRLRDGSLSAVVNSRAYSFDGLTPLSPGRRLSRRATSRMARADAQHALDQPHRAVCASLCRCVWRCVQANPFHQTDIAGVSGSNMCQHLSL